MWASFFLLFLAVINFLAPNGMIGYSTRFRNVKLEILIWHIKKRTKSCHYSLLNKIKCVFYNMDFRILIWHTRTWCPFFVYGVCTFLGLSLLITLCTTGGTVYVMFGCQKKKKHELDVRFFSFLIDFYSFLLLFFYQNCGMILLFCRFFFIYLLRF